MTKENLKSLIKEGQIEISSAVWLIKNFKLSDIIVDRTDDIDIISKNLLEFINTRISSSENLTLEEELYLFSIKDDLRIFHYDGLIIIEKEQLN